MHDSRSTNKTLAAAGSRVHLIFRPQSDLLIQAHEKSHLIVTNCHPGTQTSKQESYDNKILSFRDADW